MRSPTPARSRTSRPGTLVALSLAVAMLLTGLAVTEAGAAAALKVTVSRSISASTVLTGDAVTVAGRVSQGVAGAPVTLQRWSGGRWGTVRRTTLTASATYRFSLVSATASAYRYRVVTPPSPGRKTGISASFVVRVLTCTRSKAPASGRAAWFARPGLSSTSQIATELSRLFCAAAPGSTVNIAIYYIRSGARQADVNLILESLERVHRYRGVKVRILMEGRLYRPGASMEPSLKTLARFATVLRCNLGCHNERYGTEAKGAIMHQKMISISDMTWAPGVDPSVVMSSANWSQSQLRHRWQSAVLTYGDVTLAREVETQWRALSSCAGPGGCATFNDTLAQYGLSPSTHGMTASTNLWHDTRATERAGDPGSGLGVTFSPWVKGDPVAKALRRYTCTPAHGTVRVGHMFLTTARLSVVHALEELRAKGCRVNVVLAAHVGQAPGPGIVALRDKGVDVTCTEEVHDKIVLVDAVRVADGQPDRSVWMGSQSLSSNALRANDEAMLRLSTFGASVTAAKGNATVWNAFARHWGAIYAGRVSCG